MNLCRCEKGHFYDKEKYASCPHCSGGSVGDDGRTEAFDDEMTAMITQANKAENIQDLPPSPGDNTERYDPMELPLADKLADEPTEAIYSHSVDTATVPLDVFTSPSAMPAGGDEDDDHTIGIYDDFFAPSSVESVRASSPARKAAVNKVSTPCVGWLIALGGEHIGTDFRLKTGKNFIGRSSQMDIALTEDKSVSRERHGIVVYEPKAHLYLIQPGDSSSLVYKNDEVVLTPVKLEAYDVITVGDVNLLFMPLCGARFNWGDLIKKMKNEE